MMARYLCRAPKVSMQLDSGCSVGNVRFFGGAEMAKENTPPSDTNVSYPFLFTSFKTDALKSTDVIASDTGILMVCLRSNNPKISARIQQRVPVHVIPEALVSGCQSKNCSMHKNMAFPGEIVVVSVGVKVSTRGMARMPLPLREPLVISCIHDGYESLGKGNGAVLWFRWGCHFGSRKPEMCGRLQRPQPHSIPPISLLNNEIRGSL